MIKCQICQKEFSSKKSLEKHIAVSYGRERIAKHIPVLAYLSKYEGKNEFSKRNLKRMYESERKSTPMISEELRINKATLIDLMHYYKIHLRNTSESTINQIKRDGIWNRGKTKIDHPSIMKYAMSRKGKQNPYHTAPGFEERHRKNIERFLGIHRQQCHKRMPDSTEFRMAKILDAANIGYVRNFCLKRPDGSWRLFDFLIGNLLLEMQGNYYHANPEMFDPEDEIVISKTKRKAKDIWQYDAEKADLARQLGYNYLAIWEKKFTTMLDCEVLGVINAK